MRCHATPRRTTILLAVFFLFVATGCQTFRRWKSNGFQLGDDYRKPVVCVSDDWIDAANDSIVRRCEPMTQWWRVFNDPLLEQLVDAAYQQNLTLRSAALRVRQARLQREVSQRNLWPQSQEAFGQYARSQSSRNAARFIPPRAFDDWNTGFDVTWEADVWGRLRRQIEADDASLDAEIENYDDVLLTLIGDVAEAYIELRGFDQRIALANQNIEIQEGSLRLAQARLEEGRDSELDVQQATTNLKETEALVPSLRQGRRLALNRLAVLLGTTPAELIPFLRASGSLPEVPRQVIVGIPADLLRRRPDVRNAERNVARESALIGIAEAELYPQFTLTGEINLNSQGFSNLFSTSSSAGFIAPGFRWKILQYGRLKRNVRIQEIEFQRAILSYENAVLTAHQEVEDALARFLESSSRVEKLEASAEAAARSVELVKVQYQEGEVGFNSVFLLEAALVGSQDDLVATQVDTATALIRSYKALGGGWQLRLNTPSLGMYPMESLEAFTPTPIRMDGDSLPLAGANGAGQVDSQSATRESDTGVQDRQMPLEALLQQNGESLNAEAPRARPRLDDGLRDLELELGDLLRQRTRAQGEREASEDTDDN